MYSVRKGGVTERDEGIECTERKVERNEINLLVKSQMKERNIEELFVDTMNECAVSCEVCTECLLSRNKAERA